MPLSAQGYISSGYRQHDSLFVKALSDLFQWSRVKCRKFDRLEREMNPASNFACYRTMFKVATESNGGRVSKCISLRLPLRFKGVQDTQSLNPLRSWWNNTGRPLVPATWSYFEQCVLPAAARAVSLQPCHSGVLGSASNFCASPVVRQWCANWYCYFIFSLNSRSHSSACLSKMCIFWTRVTLTGWDFLQLLFFCFFFIFMYLGSCASYLVFYGFSFHRLPNGHINFEVDSPL